MPQHMLLEQKNAEDSRPWLVATLVPVMGSGQTYQLHHLKWFHTEDEARLELSYRQFS